MFFEKPSKKALAVLKLEILAILLLFVVFLNVVLPAEAALALEIILSALFLFFLFFETRRLFAKDFKAYAVFFVFLFAVIQANFWAQFLPITEMQLRLQVFFATAAAFLAFLLAFRFFFVKNSVSAKVLSGGKGTAIVETEFDLLAMVNAGKYSVKANKRLEKGKTVKVRVKQGFFGRRPFEIIE